VHHPSHEHQHRRAGRYPRGGRFIDVRYVALFVIAAVFLTGLVWWVLFFGNAFIGLFRRR
jgi:hypothetical protein